MKTKQNNGFSLIEVMIAVTIVALLAATSLFAVRQVREQGRDARRQADLEVIRSGLELYRADCGVYPPSLTAGSPLVGSGTPATCAATNTYIQTVPSDPTTGNVYRYNRGAGNVTYELCSTLELSSATVAPCTSGCGATCRLRLVNP